MNIGDVISVAGRKGVVVAVDGDSVSVSWLDRADSTAQVRAADASAAEARDESVTLPAALGARLDALDKRLATLEGKPR